MKPFKVMEKTPQQLHEEIIINDAIFDEKQSLIQKLEGEIEELQTIDGAWEESFTLKEKNLCRKNLIQGIQTAINIITNK